MKKRISAVILMTAIVLSGCGGAERADDEGASVTAIPLENLYSTPEAADSTSGAPDADENVYCGYERLTDSDKKLYDEICRLTEQGMTEFELSDDENDISRIYLEVVYDHPEYFWLGTGYSYTVTETNGVKKVAFRPIISDMSDTDRRKSETESIVSSILSAAEQQNTLYDKLIYVHDYLVDNTEYDDATAGRIDSVSDDDNIYDATTAYGCLVNHKAVCSGYSAAFQLLAQRLGIPCGRVTGEKIGGGSHEWNYVMLDGDYYYIDVTWDDPQSDSGTYSDTDNKTYDFFCITSAELQKTHVIYNDRFVPSCTAVDYDYYIYHGLYMDTYDRSMAADIIRREKSGAARMKFSGETELQNAVKDLIDSGGFFEISDMSSVKYNLGKAGLSLTIYLE